MFLKSVLRIVPILGLAVAMLALPGQSAFGQGGGGGRARMSARMSAVKAVAKYEERGSRRKFNFQLELGVPGQTGVVTAVAADGKTVTLGTFVVNALRRGIIDIDTTEGDDVPDLNAGSVITLVINGKTSTGTLVVR